MEYYTMVNSKDEVIGKLSQDEEKNIRDYRQFRFANLFLEKDGKILLV